MTAQRGKDLLLKIDSDGLGTFATMAGLRARAISFNARTVDVTHAESAGAWRELLAGAGVKTASLSGSGIFKDEASDALVRGYFFDGTIRDWQVIIPDFGTVEGAFQITSLEYAGSHEDELRFELALESAGQLLFTGA
ncbi:phage major tail protein, TP901-1 family [Parvibaculaceae bacterium PLY_AMNH_Bact1]|nr:phage major tail protein, TP901-1 family [Parvibaculaceae bacterium PLY_AMNH_Bact1]